MKTKIFTSDFADTLSQKFHCVNDRWKEYDPFHDFKKYVQEKPKEYHLEKTESGWRLNVLLVGFDKSEIKIDTNGSYIQIDANRKDNDSLNDLVKTSVTHKLFIGDMDEEKIQASLSNGILSLVIPSKERKSKIIIN